MGASVNGQGGWTEKRSEAVHPRCFHQRRDAVSKGGMVAVLVGESINFSGGLAWLRDNGVAVYDLHDAAYHPPGRVHCGVSRHLA